MQWQTMSKKDAQEFITKMNTDAAFYNERIPYVLNPVLEGEYAVIRERLISVYRQSLSKIESKKYSTTPSYCIDLDLAEAIYVTLSLYGFTPRDASDEEFWIYFSVNVIPDIILERFKEKDVLFQPDRYYDNPRRVYPSILWWYFYISLQDDGVDPIAYTKSILSLNRSNDISQLIERARSDGYPIELYKAIMFEYHNRLVTGRGVPKLLPRVLVLNTAHMETMEPELDGDGLESYVTKLFDEVE